MSKYKELDSTTKLKIAAELLVHGVEHIEVITQEYSITEKEAEYIKKTLMNSAATIFQKKATISVVDLILNNNDGKIGIKLDDNETNYNELQMAFLSLRLGIEAYFSTYDSIRHNFHIEDLTFSKKLENRPVGAKLTPLNTKIATSKSYQKCFFGTIVHLQHFFELILKNILQRDSSFDEAIIRNEQFKGALDKVCGLENADLKEIKIIIKYKKNLKALNELRNRILHRGLYIIFYPNLDELIGGFILPIVSEICKTKLYKKKINLWKYKPLKQGDPIKEIIKAYSEGRQPQINYITLLKEMGRAAYNNPLIDLSDLEKKYREKQKKIEALKRKNEDVPPKLLFGNIGYIHNCRYNKELLDAAKIEAIEIQKKEGFEIEQCPVCGAESLILLSHTDYNDEGICFKQTYETRCTCCGFNIDDKIKLDTINNLRIKNYLTTEVIK